MITTVPFYELDDKQKHRIWEWRNSDIVRKWMKSSDVIPMDKHLLFIDSLKNSTGKNYWLVLDNGQEIGTINLHKKEGSTAEGGLYKNPNLEIYAGQSLMSALELKSKEFGYNRIILEVIYKNTKAIHLYEKVGYKVFGKRDEYLLMEKKVSNSVFVIAELSANHNHDIGVAKKTIKAAAGCGADAVKIQTYTPDTITIDCANEYFKINQGTQWDGRTLYDLYKEAYTPWEWHEELRDYAESLGLIFFSTPFDITAVDYLEKMNNPIYKIASFEITDIPLIKYTASKNKPIIISTGIADASDIQLAVSTCRKVGNNDITLLQCTSSYPAPVEEANLKMISNLAETFGVKSGLSDHTPGSAVAIAAVALGAVLIEKHFILDRSIGGPDAFFSMEPSEFKKMVEDIRIVERAMGKVDYTLTEKKISNRKFSRSLFVVEDISAGGIITKKNVRSIRPGDGMHPQYYMENLGKSVIKKIKRGYPLKNDNIMG